MKDPCNDIRNWLFTVLNNNVSYGGATVPVYSFPPEDVGYPYILLGEQSGDGEEGAKDRWLWTVANEIKVITKFEEASDATYVEVNTIASSVLQLVRTADNIYAYATSEDYVALANYTLIGVTVGSFSTERENQETGIKISKQLTINLTVEEN